MTDELVAPPLPSQIQAIIDRRIRALHDPSYSHEWEQNAGEDMDELIAAYHRLWVVGFPYMDLGPL